MAGDLAQIAIEQVGTEIAGAAQGLGGGVPVRFLGIVHAVIMNRIRRPSNRNAGTDCRGFRRRRLWRVRIDPLMSDKNLPLYRRLPQTKRPSLTGKAADTSLQQTTCTTTLRR